MQFTALINQQRTTADKMGPIKTFQATKCKPSILMIKEYKSHQIYFRFNLGHSVGIFGCEC